jgi:hypothetical protein
MGDKRPLVPSSTSVDLTSRTSTSTSDNPIPLYLLLRANFFSQVVLEVFSLSFQSFLFNNIAITMSYPTFPMIARGSSVDSSEGQLEPQVFREVEATSDLPPYNEAVGDLDGRTVRIHLSKYVSKKIYASPCLHSVSSEARRNYNTRGN